MVGMLKHTLILPTGDPKLAARLLGEALEDLAVVPMLIFGKGAEAEQCVKWADQLASRTSGASFRRVIWIRENPSQEVAAVLGTLKGLSPAAVLAVVNFHQDVKAEFTSWAGLDPIELEAAFMKGDSA